MWRMRSTPKSHNHRPSSYRNRTQAPKGLCNAWHLVGIEDQMSHCTIPTMRIFLRLPSPHTPYPHHLLWGICSRRKEVEVSFFALLAHRECKWVMFSKFSLSYRRRLRGRVVCCLRLPFPILPYHSSKDVPPYLSPVSLAKCMRLRPLIDVRHNPLHSRSRSDTTLGTT